MIAERPGIIYVRKTFSEVLRKTFNRAPRFLQNYYFEEHRKLQTAMAEL